MAFFSCFCYNLNGGRMKKIKFYLLLFLFLFLFIIIFSLKEKEKVYIKNLFYMDTYINIKVYTKDKEIATVFKEIDNLYQDYHQLTDRYNNYKDIINIYYINNNNSEDNNLKIDERLYQILEYSLEWKEKSKGLFDIEMGHLIDLWKKHISLKTELPSDNDLTKALNEKKSLQLLGDNKILNNHPNLDLGGIAKGYVTELVGKHLEQRGFTKYIINAGGHVLVGLSYKKDLYRIGIKNPLNNELLTTVQGEKICVATSGGYERFYEHQGKTYHHIINPYTLYPGDEMISVSVISKDSKLNDILTTILFLMPVSEGLKLVEKRDDVEAIWVTKDQQIVKSRGFNAYEL